MTFIVLLLMIAAVWGIVELVGTLWRQGFVRRAGIIIAVELVIISCIAVYFTPARLSIPEDYDIYSLNISMPEGFIEIDDPADIEAMINRLKEVSYRRGFLASSVRKSTTMRFYADENMYLRVHFRGGTRDIFLHLTTNEAGLTEAGGYQYNTYGFDEDYNKLINAKQLVDYIMDVIVPKYSAQ